MIQTVGTNPAANFTPSLTGGSFSPSPLALPATYGSTVSSTLSVDSEANSNPTTPISWTNDSGGAIPTFSSLANVAAPAIVPRQNYGSYTNQNWPKVLPSGNVVAMLYDVAGSPGTPASGLNQNPQPVANAPASMSPPSISINGGAPIALSNPVYWSQNYGVIWWPLNTNDFRGIDDTDSSCVKVGSGWAIQSSDPTGMYYGGSYGYSATGSDHAIYTFNNCKSGRYQISASVQWDPSYTTHAQYLVKDGATTVGTFAVDQTQTPSFDRAYQGIRFLDLGIVTMTGTTMTVTLSNAAGSGTLSADCIRIERIQDPVVGPGDTVTFSCGFGWIDSTQGYAGQLTDVPVSVETDSTWFAFDATKTRTLKCGYNTGWLDDAYFTMNYRSRTKNYSPTNSPLPWVGDVTVATSPGGQYQLGDLMAVNSGTATYLLGQNAQNNGVDHYFVRHAAPGTWTVKYQVPTGSSNPSPNVQLIPNSYDPYAHLSTVCGTVTGPTTDPTTGKLMIQQVVTLAELTPATNSAGTAHGYNSVELMLQTDGAIIGVEVLGPEIDLTSTSLAHPDLLDRVGGNQGFEALRWMDGLSINGSDNAQFADFAVAGMLTAGHYRPTNNYSTAIASCGPADVSTADTQDIRKWNSQGSGNMFVLVTTSTAHGMTTGQWVNINNDPTVYTASDGSGYTFTLGSVPRPGRQRNPVHRRGLHRPRQRFLPLDHNDDQLDAQRGDCLVPDGFWNAAPGVHSALERMRGLDLAQRPAPDDRPGRHRPGDDGGGPRRQRSETLPRILQ